MPCHRLESERLILRPPEWSDVPAMLPLIGEWEVARNLGTVPHPYAESDAREFFDRRAERERAGVADFTFAVTQKSDGAYLGGCGVHPRDNGETELGYWLGKPHWGRGYATEAARAVARFAFAELALEWLIAGWFFDNPASGRVLDKLGFVPAGEEQRDCRSRGAKVRCYMVRLSRQAFEAAA